MSIREITEGLIGVPAVGAVAAKLVGVSCKGSDEPQFFGPGELSKFLAEYGPADPYQYSTSTTTNPPQELTLVRAGKLLFSSAPPGGVWACRAQDGAVKAVGIAITGTNLTVELTATEYGAWFNNFNYKHLENQDAEGNSMTAFSGKRVNTFWLQIPSMEMFDSNMQTTAIGSENQFYQDNLGIPFEYISQTDGSTATVGDLVSQWTSAENSLKHYFDLTASGTGTAVGDQTTWTSVFTSGDTAGTNWSSNDQASPTTAMISQALESIRAKEARITVVAGHDTSMIAIGQSHVGNASRENLEQVFICGTENEANQDTFVESVLTATEYNVSDARVIIVAPGIVQANPYEDISGTWAIAAINTDTEVTMSGGYAAALMAGIIANHAPDQSSMNKPVVGISGLEHDLTISNQKRLKRGNFYLLVSNNGYRTLDDITTAGEGDPFYQISTRMALDDIKRAIRLAGQPFIGRKNIARIRAGLRKNLEFVLQEYVRREIITSDWSLEVNSDRTQQIIGVVQVTMIIKLVFYIKYIEVDLVLE